MPWDTVRDLIYRKKKRGKMHKCDQMRVKREREILVPTHQGQVGVDVFSVNPSFYFVASWLITSVLHKL